MSCQTRGASLSPAPRSVLFHYLPTGSEGSGANASWTSYALMLPAAPRRILVTSPRKKKKVKMFFHSIKDTQACSRSIEATPDAVVAITTGKMLQTSLGGTYSKKFQVKKKSLILLLLFLQPTVQMWPSLDSASHLGVSLRGGTASVTLALERKKLLITRESSGKRLGRTDPSQETHFLFIFVSYLDSRGSSGVDQYCCPGTLG